MKILHVTTGLNTGGAEIALCKLLTAIDRTQFDAAVVSLQDKGTIGSSIEALGVPVYTLGLRGSLPVPAAIWRLRRLVRQLQPDIIHGWMYHGNLAAWLARRFAPSHTPLVWGIRHTDTENDKRLTRLVVRLGSTLSSHVDTTVYVARASQALHESLGYGGTSLVIPNGFDLNQFAPSGSAKEDVSKGLGLKPPVRLVGSLGRYHPMKDHANLLAAAALVVRQIPHAHFVLAGLGVDNKNHELQHHISTLDVIKNVHLLGERKDAARLMAAMDVYVSPSASGEAFPQVLGEAMACGTPCVATDVGDSAYILGDCGRVVPPRNAQALAAGIIDLLQLPADQHAKLGAACRMRIQVNFSLDEVARQYAALYEQLTNNAACNHPKAGPTI